MRPFSPRRTGQVAGSVGTLEVLPCVVAAVNDQGPVLFDGGIRRGVDVFEAVARSDLRPSAAGQEAPGPSSGGR